MKNRKPGSKKLWYAKKYGMAKTKKKKKEFVFTMKPVKSGWMRYPLVARAIIWDFFYEPEPGVRKRGIDKNRTVLVFFTPDSFIHYSENNYIPADSEAMALDLNDAAAVKNYITEIETAMGAGMAKTDLYLKSAALNHRKNKSAPRTSLKYIKAEPEFCNELLCSSISSTTRKIWHWDTPCIKIIGDYLVATIKEEKSSREVFISPNGHRVRQESFEVISPDNIISAKWEGALTVKEPHKPFGYFNEKLEYVFQPEFEYAGDFENGYAIASTADSLFILREDGTRISLQEKISLPIVRAKNFSEGVARVSVFDISDEDVAYFTEDPCDLGCWFYITTEGKIITKPEYIIAHDMHHGLAFVCKGKWYKDPKFDHKYKQNAYWSDEMLWGAIDKTGKEVIPCRYERLSYLDDNTTYLAASIIKNKKELWGVIDRDSNWIVKPRWPFCPDSLTEYLIIFSYEIDEFDAPCGVYSLKTNSVIIKPLFYEIELSENNTIKATSYGSTITYFDLQGKFLWEEEKQRERNKEDLPIEAKEEDWKDKYDNVYKCHDGYKVEVSYDGYSLFGFVDFEGTSILPCIFPSLSMEKKLLVFEKKYKCGLMDFDENVLIPPQYDSICINKDEYDECCNPFPGKIKVRRGDYIGIFHLDGTMLIPPIYLVIQRIDNDFCLCETRHGYDMLKIENL